MRAVIGFFVAVAIPSFAFAPRVAPQPIQGSAAEQEVRQVENARREALLRNDIAALDRLIADTYLATLGDGQVVGKAEALAVNRAGQRQVESWEETNVVIRLYGATAVVTGLAAVKDRLTAGTRASQILRNETGARDFTFRFTHIWARLDGRWQLVGRHLGRGSDRRGRAQ